MLNSQLEGSSKQFRGFGIPGFVLLNLCYLYQLDLFSIFSDDTFSLRYKLSLPGVSHSIIENICSSLAETAKDVLLLERNCGGSIMKNSPIYLAFCRSIMETIRLHRTLVLKLGTVKSLPLFVKMTRRCCGGIRFIR